MKKELEKGMFGILTMPNLIVSCRGKAGNNNALAVGFAANVSTNPPLVMIGIVPEHYSYDLIKESKAFVINIPGKQFQKEFYYLGSKSGRDEDKFSSLNLKWTNGIKVDAPLLDDCPYSAECKVIHCVKAGDHDLFIGSIETVHCEEAWLDENGNLDFSKIETM